MWSQLSELTVGGATLAPAISMSFHRVPQRLLGDSISGMDLSLHRKVTTPRGTTRSARQLRQATVSESPKQIRFPTFIRSSSSTSSP
ncbi:hypothetical protein CgunFtcFv8_004185 [Champsocephalus gunnari]|uniref:Uncharacterized protein n=1 Tax=Champsocephalus gunnari TaxID=52237 RepID=A0AAN8I7F6_CHAGU|nr:hypothetical protein CgunFtcFv8_004185 [Champsocephalus gunnari]